MNISVFNPKFTRNAPCYNVNCIHRQLRYTSAAFRFFYSIAPLYLRRPCHEYRYAKRLRKYLVIWNWYAAWIPAYVNEYICYTVLNRCRAGAGVIHSGWHAAVSAGDWRGKWKIIAQVLLGPNRAVLSRGRRWRTKSRSSSNSSSSSRVAASLDVKLARTTTRRYLETHWDSGSSSAQPSPALLNQSWARTKSTG